MVSESTYACTVSLLAFRKVRCMITPVFAAGSFWPARSTSTVSPALTSSTSSGGSSTPASILPASSAAVRLACEPTAMMFTSLSGSSPADFSAARVAKSLDGRDALLRIELVGIDRREVRDDHQVAAAGVGTQGLRTAELANLDAAG